jgi:hypothetical protein
LRRLRGSVFMNTAANCSKFELQKPFRAGSDTDPFPLGVGIGLDAGEAVTVEGGYRGGALNLRRGSAAVPRRARSSQARRWYRSPVRWTESGSVARCEALERARAARGAHRGRSVDSARSCASAAPGSTSPLSSEARHGPDSGRVDPRHAHCAGV